MVKQGDILCKKIYTGRDRNPNGTRDEPTMGMFRGCVLYPEENTTEKKEKLQLK